MAEDTTQPDLPQRRLAAERFLAGVEQRAFRMALIATRQRDEAMDIVQDAMLAWVSHYLGHPREAWKPLFYKVLQSRIRDWQRRATVRRRVMAWFGRGGGEGEAHLDELTAIADPAAGDPASTLAHRQTLEKLLHALERLPLRQQQAFLLRSWEGLDVAETALAMGCSAGSVKTHLSRAMISLRAAVGDSYE
jgi:RNA polymerase sigma-70 factor, ECF subfamily